jgi:hypothetical protein
MGTAIAAIALYFAIVFGVGLALGPLRVLLLEPRLGALAAVAIEMPLLLIAMVVAARWVPRRLEFQDRATLAAMGGGALLLVFAADFAVGLGLRGLSLEQQLRQFSTPAGLLYAASLAAFAAMPLIVNRARGGGG